MNDAYRFNWQISEGGYVWQKRPEEKRASFNGRSSDLVLVPLGSRARSYVPNQDLFLTFAKLGRNSSDRMLEFANEYGLLSTATDEPFMWWSMNVETIGSVVSLWRAVKSADAADLAKYIEWSNREQVNYRDPTGRTLPIANSHIRSHLLEELVQGDALSAASAYLRETVNEHLRKLVAPRLVPAGDRKKMSMYIVPESLLGNLWWQFARAISNSQTFRNCSNPNCGELMLVAPEGTGYRSHRTTCSEACRARLYIDRKAEARRLHEDDGLSAREIAKRLDANIDSVKRWISAN
jgi:hypothetical protein